MWKKLIIDVVFREIKEYIFNFLISVNFINLLNFINEQFIYLCTNILQSFQERILSLVCIYD